MAKNAFQNISLITVISIVNLIAGILYSMMQVRIFGTDRVIEIFFAAQTLVYLVTSLSQSGQLSEIFLPIYLKLKTLNSASVANKAFSLMLNRMLLYVFIFIVVIYFVCPIIIKLFIPGFSSSDQAEAMLLFRCFLPLILLQILSSFLNTILNAENIYGRVEIISFFSVLVSILLLWLFYSRFGVWTLLFVSYIGVILQILTSLLFIVRMKIKYSLVWNMSEFDHKELFKTFFSTIRYSLSTQLLNWALTSSISFFPPGVYALYNYVNMIFAKITNVFVQPLSMIFFTKISTYVNDKERINSLFDKAQKFGFYIGFTFFIFLIVNGKEFLSVFLGEKKFTDRNILDAYFILIPLSFSFIFQNWFSLNRKIAVSFGKAKSFYNLSTLMMIISALLTYFLIYLYRFPGLMVSILVTKILFLISPYIINKMDKKITMDFRYVPKLIFLSIFIIAVSFFLKIYILSGSWSNISSLILSLFTTTIVSLTTVALFAKNDVLEIVKIIKRDK